MLNTARFQPLTAMDAATMRAVFNHLAAERGKPPAKRGADRFELGKGIALLRATSKPPAPKPPPKIKTDKRVDREPVVRKAALEELARVVEYTNDQGETIAANVFEKGNYPDDDWYSVGLPYADIVDTIRKRIPTSRVSLNVLRRIAHLAKKQAPGYDAVLPERRPSSRHRKRMDQDNGQRKGSNRSGGRRVASRLDCRRRAKRGIERRLARDRRKGSSAGVEP